MAHVLRQRLCRRRIYASAPAISITSAVTTRSICAAASPLGYKRIEAEFMAPRLFNRRGSLSVIGGWREATQRRLLWYSERRQRQGRSHELLVSAAIRPRPCSTCGRPAGTLCSAGDSRSAVGSGARAVAARRRSMRCIHPIHFLALARAPPMCIRRGQPRSTGALPRLYATGGYLGVTGHDFADTDDRFSFHTSGLRLHSAHAGAERHVGVVVSRPRAKRHTAIGGQVIPYFMLP